VILYAAHGSAILKGNPYLTRFVAQPLGVLLLAPVFLARPPFLNILPLYVHYLAAVSIEGADRAVLRQLFHLFFCRGS
jgi:hypothetical protein